MIEEVVKEAMGLVTPSEEDIEKLDRIAGIISKRLDGLGVKWEFGGSYAHGTWLPEDVDIDVFIKFPPELGEKAITERGLEVAKKALKGYPTKMRYAEHPYLEGFIEGIRINLVPCAEVKDKRWVTAADRSPLHTRFMKKALDDRLKNEVRLLKKFVKAQGLYGAEIKVKGFSGYVCEVLIVKYGSFAKALEAISKWRKGEVVAIGRSEKARKLYEGLPLIIVDPVDEMRNLALAISPQKVGRLILLSRIFLNSPSIEFFTEHVGWNGSINKENVVCILFSVPEHVEDVLWGELWKTARAIVKQMRIMGYDVLKVSIAAEEGKEACIALLLDRLGKKFSIKKGPEVFMQKDVEKFLSKHEKDLLTWVGEDLRLYSLARHKWQTAKEAAEELMKRPVMYGVAKGIADCFSSGKVLTHPFPEIPMVKEALKGLEKEDVCPRR